MFNLNLSSRGVLGGIPKLRASLFVDGRRSTDVTDVSSEFPELLRRKGALVVFGRVQIVVVVFAELWLGEGDVAGLADAVVTRVQKLLELDLHESCFVQ